MARYFPTPSRKGRAKEEHCRACRPQNEYNLRVSHPRANQSPRRKRILCSLQRASLMHLSIYLLFADPPSERNTQVHFTRPPCIFAKFAIKTEVRGSRFASMTFPGAIPENFIRKKYSPSFRATRELHGDVSRIDFLRRETKYSLHNFLSY